MTTIFFHRCLRRVSPLATLVLLIPLGAPPMVRAEERVLEVLASEKASSNCPEPPHEGRKDFFTLADNGQGRGVVVCPADGPLPPAIAGDWASGGGLVEHYRFQACRPDGRKDTVFEFPGITQLADGELFSIFIEETGHGPPASPVMPTSSKLWSVRSGDWGKTWTRPVPFLDTPLADRHAYVLQLRGGPALAFFWVQAAPMGVPGIFNYVARSDDGGRTWQDPIRFRSGQPAKPQEPQAGIRGSSSLTVPPLELPNGTIAMPIHCARGDRRPAAETGVLRSTDGGRTWGDYSTIARDLDGRTSYLEPALVRLASGKWLAVMRTHSGPAPDVIEPHTYGPTMVCESEDEGRTWSPPQPMPLDFAGKKASAPFIVQTRTGVIVFAVNVAVALSRDEGRRWFVQNGKEPLGYYPNFVEIAPGTLATMACNMHGRVVSLAAPEQGVLPEPRALAARPSPPPAPDAADDHPAPAPPATAIEGCPRVIRLRPPRDRRMSPLLAQPALPLLAVAKAKAGDRSLVAGMIRGTDDRWTRPFVVAEAAGLRGAPVLSQAPDGRLLCLLNVSSGATVATSSTRSCDRGRTWSPAAGVVLEPSQTPLRMTAPAVADGQGRWTAAAEIAAGPEAGAGVIVQSDERATNWRRLATLPGTPGKNDGLAEPSLAVGRAGRWVVLGKRAGAPGQQEILLTMSHDEGRTWSPPRPTGMKGLLPEIVELLDTLFLIGVQDARGRLQTAFAWDELQHFTVRDLAYGYCIRVPGDKRRFGRGSGVDMAGEYHCLSHVPLLAEEAADARRAPIERIPTSAGAMTFRGSWESSGQGEETLMSGRDGAASLAVECSGSAVFLVHDVRPDGRLMSVRIDDEAYSPVQTRGQPAAAVRTCLAADLPPGRHTVKIYPALPKRSGKVSIRAVETSP